MGRPKLSTTFPNQLPGKDCNYEEHGATPIMRLEN